jgi:hypothetical protein
MAACDCGGGKNHLPGCSSLDSAPAGKKRRNPRGPKCPECGAVMSGGECAFTASHATIKQNRAARGNAASAALRGKPKSEAAAEASRTNLRAAHRARREAAAEARRRKQS